MRDHIEIEKVYPLSILEGIQKGEIFVDHDEAPTVALVWHYFGFANIVGDYDERFIEETTNMMRNPPDGHSVHMALQTGNDSRLEALILRIPKVARHERYIFEFTGEKYDIPHTMAASLKEITADNYGQMNGRIVSAAMIKETLRRGKSPVWDCDIRNEASMRLACSVGFEIEGTHPWYTYEA